MDRAQIETRLRHSGAMLLLDRVESWSEDTILCSARTHRSAQNPLRTSRGLSVLAGIEYSGQAIALHASLTAPDPLGGGVLAALRHVRWEAGDMSAWVEDLTIHARRLARTASAANYEFSVSRDGREVLAGTALVAFARATRA